MLHFEPGNMDINHPLGNALSSEPFNLPEKGELYRTLARNFPNGAVLLFDQDLRYILADGIGLNEIGLSSQMLEGKTIWEIFPEEVCRVLEPRYRAALDGEPSDFEVNFAGRIYHVHTLPIHDNQGAISTGMVMTQDITARKNIEESLLRSQQSYEQLVNSIDGIVWEGDAQTFQYFFVSKQAERLLGYPTARWLDEPTFWQDHIHPEDREWAVNFCVLSTANKKDHVFEYRMIAADGRVVWLRDIVTVIIENDTPVKLRGIMVDITENKQVEAELLEREQQYRSIFETVSDALFINRLEDGKLVDFNPAAAFMHGYTEEEFRNLQPKDFIHPDSHHIFGEYIKPSSPEGSSRGAPSIYGKMAAHSTWRCSAPSSNIEENLTPWQSSTTLMNR
jgi:PAS domain S-box-containing protein